MSTEVIPLKEPCALAGLAAELPTVFVPDEKTAERFFGFFSAPREEIPEHESVSGGTITETRGSAEGPKCRISIR